jgi:hypothetical protein
MALGGRSITGLELIEKNWNVLVQVATWLSSLIAGFLLPPPVGSVQGDGGALFKFAQFVVTVFVGLMAIPILKWRQRADTWVWWTVALATLLGGIAAFFSYSSLTDSWTEWYANRQVVIGSELNEDAQEYAQEYRKENPEHKKPSPAQLLLDFPGGPENVWTKSSIDRRRHALGAIYVLCMPLFTLCVIAVTQAIYCFNRPDSAGGPDD